MLPATPAVPARPRFLVAYLREGGNVPVQGAVLVQGESLQGASAAAMLNAELEADIKERGELPEAMVMLLNASEVPPLSAGTSAGAGPRHRELVGRVGRPPIALPPRRPRAP